MSGDQDRFVAVAKLFPLLFQLFLGVFEVKVLVATLIRSLEFRPTGQTLRTVPLPTLQPITEGVEGSLPLFVYPVS